MPDTGCLLLSLGALVLGTMFVLFARPLSKLSEALNRTIMTLDESLMRYRYLIALALFVVSYGLFNLSFVVPGLGG